MRRKLKVGDVFVVPIGDDRAGVGQIVATSLNSLLYLAIFDAVLPLESTTASAAGALNAPLLFLGLSTDAKLHAGDWVAVAHAPVSADVPLPAYKESVGFPPRVDVVDFSGDRRRPATLLEASTLPNRALVAPVRFERALKAWFGLEPWVEAFDELRPEGRITTAELFG